MENEQIITILYKAIKGYETYVCIDELWQEINFKKHSPMVIQYLQAYSSVPMQNLVRRISFTTEKWSERYYYFDEYGGVHMKNAPLKPKSIEELLKNLKDCVAHNVEQYKILLEKSQEYNKTLIIKQLEGI